MAVKLEWLGYRMVNKLWRYVKPLRQRFHLIPERYGQTDRQTDGRTDGQNCYINIARQCADAR